MRYYNIILDVSVIRNHELFDVLGGKGGGISHYII